MNLTVRLSLCTGEVKSQQAGEPGDAESTHFDPVSEKAKL